MLKRLLNRKKKGIKVNKQVAELIQAHGFKTKIKGDKVIPKFKDQIQIETWVYPKEIDTGLSTRLDVNVKFKNGIELYEAFGDVASNLNESIKRNLESFASSSLHVFIDAFNDSNKYVNKGKWQIGNYTFDVFSGNYNLKSFKNLKIDIPKNIDEIIQESISQYKLDDEYYFIRFYYAHMNHKHLTIEFMINNIKLENEEKTIKNLNWMVTKDFYSVRNFIILKRKN